MSVDEAKLERYAMGLARELKKAPERGPKSRAYWIGHFEQLLRRELAIIDAEATSNDHC